MDAIGSGTAAGEAGTRPAAPPPRRRGGRITLFVLGLAAMLLVADFFWFVYQMPTTETAPSRNADGIVALTGGDARLDAAVALLEKGSGQRLLIRM